MTEPARTVRPSDYRYPGETLSICLTLLALIVIYTVFVKFILSTPELRLKTLLITAAGLLVYLVTVLLQQRSTFGSFFASQREAVSGDLSAWSDCSATTWFSACADLYQTLIRPEHLYSGHIPQ